MFQFATTCVDNFFKYPDEIVNLAETLDYKPHSEGMWPGARSPELHTINPALKTKICTKYLKLHLSAPMVGYTITTATISTIVVRIVITIHIPSWSNTRQSGSDTRRIA